MGSGEREERANREGLFSGERKGIGKRKKSGSGKNKECRHEGNEMLRAVWAGCQAALALSNSVCSGTGNSQLMGRKFLADFRSHDKSEWFPSHPQPLLAPWGDGICAPSAPSPHSSTMAVLTPALGNANRGS